MSAFNTPSRDALFALIDIVADAVEGAKIEEYCRFTVSASEAHLRAGYSPILLLAAAQVFENAVLVNLTPDQQDVVGDLFLAAGDRRQVLLYERVIGLHAQGA
jgi:hypothetical protein